MINLRKIKYNDKIVTRVVVVTILLVVFVILPYEFFIDSISIRFLKKDYCNFKGFLGYSNLEIFPENPTEMGEVTDYFYLNMNTFMDPTCKVYTECVFKDEEKFEQECNRLSQIAIKMDDKVNKIHYSEDIFRYPAYIACYNYNSCDEYALIIEEEKKIVYVFLQGISLKVDEEYMPLNQKDVEKIPSIYYFDGHAEFKYRKS